MDIIQKLESIICEGCLFRNLRKRKEINSKPDNPYKILNAIWDEITPDWDLIFEDIKNKKIKANIDHSFTFETLNLKNVEKEIVERALELCGGDTLKASWMLGISRTAVYNKINKFVLGEQNEKQENNMLIANATFNR